jgi:5-methylcytosine-specific restriction endonuclease McrA
MYPFTIRLVDRRVEDSVLQPMRLSIDPGSKTSGLSLARVEEGEGGPVLHPVGLFELAHRGQAIRDGLQKRSAFRRNRRNRKTRYRAPRFLNRGNKARGWLAPSLMHRVDTTMSWVRRLARSAPVTELAQELVRFDTQLLQAQAEGRNIEGAEYQRGTLFGFEVGEYLLAKWNRKCAYCNAENVPLEKDHIIARSKGGSDRVSNLALACRPCNEKKGNRDVREFLARSPQRLAGILAQAKAPLKDAAAVNATRWKLYGALQATGLPVQTGSGGLTKFNRTRLDLPKAHCLDALCVGNVSDVGDGTNCPVLHIRSRGRGAYCRTRVDASGFPKGYYAREKSAFGFRTGDMVKAIVPSNSRKTGQYLGRVAVRQSGSFNIQTRGQTVQGISYRYCRVIQRGDGYSYQLVAQPTKGSENRAEASPRALSLPGINAGASRATR